MDKNNLDDFFRQKFKAFREIPDEKVWTDIERSLDKKRKKRVIPLWWKLGGVAAVLAIALITFYPFGNTEDKTPSVTDTENPNSNGANQDNGKTDKKADADIEKNINQKNALPSPDMDEGVASGSKESNSKNRMDSVLERPKPLKQSQWPTSSENKLTQSGDDIKKSENATEKQKLLDVSVEGQTKSQVTENQNEPIDSPTRGQSKSRVTENRREPLEKSFEDSGKVQITENNEKSPLEFKEEQLGNQLPEVKRESSSDGLAEKAADSDQDEKKKSLSETLEEKADEEEVAETSGNRWSAGPSVAPVYFNALGEGSPIDPGFSPNAKSGNTNFSYGISVAYAVTDKLSLRSGVRKTDYGYDTNNVPFSPTLDASAGGRLQNIDYSNGTGNLSVNAPLSNADSPNSFEPEFNSLSFTREGTVAQQFGYLEIPLELDYALVDNRFGFDIIGGISSLFLLDNSVTLNSGELISEIGEASNLNSLNFSTNIGFGMNYKLTPKIKLNVEPIFKYQLNTFSNTSGNFRPYSIGVYSGLNFRF